MSTILRRERSTTAGLPVDNDATKSGTKMNFPGFLATGGLLAILVVTPQLHADTVEFLSGAKAEGTVKSIRKDKKEFDFEIQIAGRRVVRTYSFAQVRAVTMKGKRYVLSKAAEPQAAADSRAGAAVDKLRSRAAVEQLIETAGRTPPEWFDATPLDYPSSLDLSWPLKPPTKGWNNQKNMGQYLWDVINPNPNRWRAGIRLVHHVMTRHKDNPELLKRDMETLGSMYFRLLQDYPRAAFWFQKAGSVPGQLNGVLLGECYWRLGNKQMALRMVSGRRLAPQAIKLLGDMGETRRALQIAEAFARQQPHEAYLLAGDACRSAGRLREAVVYYQKVLDAPAARNEDYEKRFRGRATDSMEAIQLFDQADVARVRAGTYRGQSVGYNGTVEVEVRVANHRIEAVEVVRHQEKQFYAALTDTPGQILRKQTVRGIDATSRATITSQAIVNATARALAKGAP